jgi:prevent-host-death family protein
MSRITATDAKNRFGQLLEMAQRGPVHIQKNGRDVGVLVSPDEYAAFAESKGRRKVRPIIEELLEESIAKRRKLYEALAR